MTSSDSADNNFDIIIVGSGLTGLTTAYNVLRRRVGLSILILEKNGRMSEGYFGSYSQRNITALLDQLEIPIESAQDPDGGGLRNFIFVTKTPEAGGSSDDHVSRLVSGQVYHFLKLLNWMSTAGAVNEYATTTNNRRLLGAMSIERLMESMVTFRRARILCTSLLRACWPGIEHLTEVSALWFLVALSGAGGLFEKLSASLSVETRFFVEAGDGFERLVETLEKKIGENGAIVRRCENVVKIVEQEDRRIRVTSECNMMKRGIRRYGCECVVVAVPPPANAGINVETRRLLAEERFIESWKVYQGGSNVYFCGRYKEAFLPASSALFEGNNGPTRTIHVAGRRGQGETSRTIAGFTSSARDLEGIQAALEVYFGVHDPTSFGTSEASPVYAPRPSYQEHYLARPYSLDGRIIFAASEFASEWPGTADGAVEASREAARAVLSRLRPQALEASETAAIKPYPPRVLTLLPLPPMLLHGDDLSSEANTAVRTAHAICLGLNVSLLFILLGEAWNTS